MANLERWGGRSTAIILREAGAAIGKEPGQCIYLDLGVTTVRCAKVSNRAGVQAIR
jgi:hypothetical protein